MRDLIDAFGDRNCTTTSEVIEVRSQLKEGDQVYGRDKILTIDEKPDISEPDTEHEYDD